MPALPGKASRRKGATPTTKPDKVDVWQRTLDLMGKELLSASSKRSIAAAAAGTATSAAMASNGTTIPSTAPGASGSPVRKLTLLDLPIETQKDIFKHADSLDLIALSLVSKHFREIAAQQLYRCFHIVFPDEDDPAYNCPNDSLAGGLETFVSSEYNYAQHLREFILDTLSPGDKGERSYRHYTYDVSCGKFMNTLLLLTLRKARALETFRWDIRVELSRQVFKALHNIQALQHLHIRMQAGGSMYQAPPALPALGTSITTNSMTGASHFPHHAGLPPPPTLPVSHAAPALNMTSFSLASKVSSRVHYKQAQALIHPKHTVPPTLSGFKNLKSLSILDMDSLEYIDEIQACIKNSSSTLNSLRLSFSDSFANKSRKPPPEVLSDDETDQEDEFGPTIPSGPPPPSGGASDPNGPSKAAKAQEEKKKQEAVLGRIFGLDVVVLKPKPAPSVPAPKVEEAEVKSDDDPKRRFIRNLAPVAAKLMAHVTPGSDLTDVGKETLALIEKAAKHYMDSVNNSKDEVAAITSGSTSKAKQVSSNVSVDGVTESETLASDASTVPTQTTGLFDKSEPKKKGNRADLGVSNPDDIDIEEPEGQELSIEFEAPTEAHLEPVELPTVIDELPIKPAPEASSQAGRSVVEIDSIGWANRIQLIDHAIAIRVSHEEIQKEGEALKDKMETFKAKLQSGSFDQTDHKEVLIAEAEFHRVVRRVEELERSMQEINEQMVELNAAKDTVPPVATLGKLAAKMSEYIRETRGLAIRTLSIYLIPIKATILSKAIDLNVLRNITMLNVGPQTPFWNLLGRENKLSPIPIRKIHTDNVTLPFLAFVHQLESLEELYLLERGVKARVDSTAAKTTISIEQIRKMVLKKHASTLKVLMIRNDSGTDWDLNVKTILLLCQHAKNLEEMAVSFGVKAMHTLLQHMPGLASLRALHTIQFRTDDACSWVKREFRKFTVDNISHNPDMKLEYLALDNTVECLVRRKSSLPKVGSPRSSKDLKGKGKESSSAKLLAELVMGPGGVWPDGSGIGSSAVASSLASGMPIDWQDSSDDENEFEGLKIELVEGIRFCEAVGVKIFEKEILSGRL